MNVRTLLKKATSLKKQNKVEEAIKVLYQAYEIGIYEPPSTEIDNVDDYIDEDKLLVLADLVRKAKYLQEIGKIDEAIVYLDKLIEDTSNRANYNIWEIHELSDIHNHKAIVLKKEKRYNDEFIETSGAARAQNTRADPLQLRDPAGFGRALISGPVLPGAAGGSAQSSRSYPCAQ